MQNLKSKTILLILSYSILMSLTTCKKYPQDGKFSLYTANDRLTTTWILTQFLIDGDDVTNSTFNYGGYSYSLNETTLKFDYFKVKMANGKYKKVFSSYIYVKNIIPDHIDSYSTYTFYHNKSKISFDSNAINGSISIFQNPTNELWTIKKLLKKDFIIETANSSGKKIHITFIGA